MTVQELKNKLEFYDPDRVVIIKIGEGWDNIGKVTTNGITVALEMDKSPLFQD